MDLEKKQAYLRRVPHTCFFNLFLHGHDLLDLCKSYPLKPFRQRHGSADLVVD